MGTTDIFKKLKNSFLSWQYFWAHTYGHHVPIFNSKFYNFPENTSVLIALPPWGRSWLKCSWKRLSTNCLLLASHFTRPLLISGVIWMTSLRIGTAPFDKLLESVINRYLFINFAYEVGGKMLNFLDLTTSIAIITSMMSSPFPGSPPPLMFSYKGIHSPPPSTNLQRSMPWYTAWQPSLLSLLASRRR